jgi:hypothetical protein
MNKKSQDSNMEVKGKAISVIPRFIKKNFGEEGLVYWLHQISEEARGVYDSKIDDNKWYPLKRILIEPSANLAQLFFDWDLKKACWSLGRYSAEYRFSGVSRLVVKFPSPNYFIAKGVEFLPEYYRPCRMEVVENVERHGVVRIIEFPEIDLTTEFRIAGWMERGLELNGCRNVKVEIRKSLVRFDPVTEYSVRWSSRRPIG